MGSMVRILHLVCGLIYTFSQTASHESLTGLHVSGRRKLWIGSVFPCSRCMLKC